MDILKLWRRFCIIVGLLLIYGYISNIVTIYNSSFNDITGVTVLRLIGIIIAPLGGIMGYL